MTPTTSKPRLAHRGARCLALSLGVAFCLLFLAGCPPSQPQIVGKWAGIGSPNEAGVFEFHADGNFVGRPASGREERGTYSVNFSTAPVSIDFIAQGVSRSEGILKFHGGDEIEMAVGVPGYARPVSFGQGRHYVMKRLAE
jgi:hypothetical protein